MTKRLPYTYEFSVRSDNGGERVIICSEESAATGVESQAHYVPAPKTYSFKGGDPAAMIGDLFLDCSGEIYRRST